MFTKNQCVRCGEGLPRNKDICVINRRLPTHFYTEPKEKYKELTNEYKSVGKMIGKMIAEPDKWCKNN